MENLRIVTPASHKLWHMAIGFMVSTLAATELLDLAEPMPIKPDVLPSANPLMNHKFDVGNIDLLIQIAEEAELRFMDFHGENIRAAHAHLTAFNASDDVAEFMLEAPRSYAEIDSLFAELWETQQSLDAIEFQFSETSTTEAPVFCGLNHEKLGNMAYGTEDEFGNIVKPANKRGILMIADTFQEYISRLCLDKKRIGIIENGVMRHSINAETLNDRWLLYLENCELSFVVHDETINPLFKSMRSTTDVMNFLSTLAMQRLDNPYQFIAELFDFYALVVCGSYAQLLHTVNFREVENDLDFELEETIDFEVANIFKNELFQEKFELLD